MATNDKQDENIRKYALMLESKKVLEKFSVLKAMARESGEDLGLLIEFYKTHELEKIRLEISSLETQTRITKGALDSIVERLDAIEASITKYSSNDL